LSALQRFVRDFEDFLKKFEIVTTEGCRRALLRSGLLQTHRHFKAELPGYLGGIVHLSALVVSEEKRVEAVIYLIDPKDLSSIFPETNAIKRECVVHQITFLSTSRAAREWATIKWKSPEPHFVTPKNLQGLRLVRSLEEETIALIAHDGKKKELLKFAREHFDFLLRFRSRVATGTTGGLLNGGDPDPSRLNPAECKELAPLCRDLAARIQAAKKKGKIKRNEQFVDKKPSGPLGGDVVIARMVLSGSCRRIVFFENPLEPHEHTEDIQLLERTGRLCGKSTICIHDQSTAAWFVGRWKAAAKDPQPLLLSFVIERLFGAKCILVESRENWRDTWEDLREAAAWFVLSHIATIANERKKLSESVRFSVAWGVGSSQVAKEVVARLDRLRVLEQSLWRRPTFDRDDLEDGSGGAFVGSDYPFQTPSLADDDYFRPRNVIVAPIQGLVGSEDEDVEANEVASYLAEFFRGTHLPLAANVLVKRGGDTDRRRRRIQEVYDHWSTTDVILATAGPLLEHYEDRPRTPHFVGFTKEMGKLGACGDLAGLFLDPRGRPIIGDHFERVGMSAEQMKKVCARRGTIVVAGAQAERAEITLAALIGGWVSVLVTDTRFARNLISSASKLVLEGELGLISPDNDGPLVETARF
jgi:methylglyoxal synthase